MVGRHNVLPLITLENMNCRTSKLRLAWPQELMVGFVSGKNTVQKNLLYNELVLGVNNATMHVGKYGGF